MRRLQIGWGGVGLVCTEFVRITSAPPHPRRLAREVVRDPRCPLSVQVMGNEAERLAEAATIVARAGADVVDINLGCPMPRIVRKGVGAAMLKDLVLLGRVVRSLRRATEGLLSAKIRAGFDHADDVIAIARLIEAEGADFITVHPRKRCDLYRGVADWRIIAAIKAELAIPVVGNGDAWYATDAVAMRRETGCDAVMLGRPALRNPFLFQQIAALERGEVPPWPDGPTLLGRVDEICAAYQAHYGALGRDPTGPLKELVSWLSRAVADGGAFRKRALREPSFDRVLAVVRETLGGLPKEALDLDAGGRLGLEQSGTLERKALGTLMEVA